MPLQKMWLKLSDPAEALKDNATSVSLSACWLLQVVLAFVFSCCFKVFGNMKFVLLKSSHVGCQDGTDM